jgi:large subunit ribosomal protein L24
MKPITKPTKQRKRVFQAPDHVRYKLFAAPLSAELKATHKTKSLPVRTGDTVKVMRGDHKGFEGKISRVDRSRYRVYVEGITREKVDGSTIFVAIHPSKLLLTNLVLDDKWRKQIIERKKTAAKKAKEIAEKVEKKPKKIVEVKEEIIEEKPVEEKAPEKKPRRRKKPAEKLVEEKPTKAPKKAKMEEKPKEKKPRAKRKTAKKAEGGT